MSDTPAFGSQADFARANGWAKSYVTALKQAGRLVLAEDGRVDFAASLERIRATTGAPERAAPQVQGEQYAGSSEREKFYASELRRLEYEREVRQSLATAEVDAAVDDVAAIIRTGVEAWRSSLAPQLAAVGGDEARIEALLAAECEVLLRRLADRFAKLAAADEGGG